jgi:hypothetical protein
MNEVKQIAKERQTRVVRKDSNATSIAVWTLVALELARLALPYIEVLK